MMKPHSAERQLEKRLSIIGKSYLRISGDLLRRIDAIARRRGPDPGSSERAYLRELGNTPRCVECSIRRCTKSPRASKQNNTQPDD
jgi:hypothetical protein